MKPVFYPGSFLEESAIFVDGAAEGFPAEALGDRDIELLWKDTVGGTRTIRAQWTGVSGPPAVDAWILPAGHGLAGTAVTLQSGPDGASWTTRDSVTPSSSGTLLRTLPAPITAAWWRLVMTTGPAAYLSELYLTAGVALPYAPSMQSLEDGLVGDVTRRITPGGTVRKSRHWGQRWRANWTFIDIDVPKWEELLASVYAVLEGRFCYLRDHNGIIRFVELREPAWMGEAAAVSRRDVRVELQEVTPA